MDSASSEKPSAIRPAPPSIEMPAEGLRSPTSPGSRPAWGNASGPKSGLGKLFGAFTKTELRALVPLCGVYALRVLGLYMVLPVLSVHARALEGSTSFLTGMSLGAYGFSNMLLVLPLGILSDAIGRRRVIALGMALFAGGSFLAAWAPSIGGLLAGRALQGAGAVSSVVVALVGDVTRPEVRARGMTFLGMSVGLAFSVGAVAGPALAGEFGIDILFVLTGVLSLTAMALVLMVVPNPAQVLHSDEYEPRARDARGALLHPDLLTLDAGMFLVYFALTALFVVVPILLEPLLPPYHLWRVYAPVVLLGMAIGVPVLVRAERMHASQRLLYVGIGLFCAACLVMREFSERLPGMLAGMTLFVLSVGLLEPTLTSLLTRYTTRESRGTAAGIFSMAGFFGTFVGGAAGGLLLESSDRLFVVLAGLSLLWLAAATRLKKIDDGPA